MSLSKNRIFSLALGAGILAVAAIQGCSSDPAQVNPTTTGGTGGSSTTGGSGGRTSGGSAGKGGTSGTTGGKSGSGGDIGAAGEAGSGPTGGCNGTDGCYSCAPKTDLQFLNHCVPGGCPSTYDNSKLTRLVAGKLPALP